MKIFILIITIGLSALLGGSWFIAGQLVRSANTGIDDPPSDMFVAQVEFDGVTGWFAGNDNNRACVLLMHGIRSNRLSMIDRARFLLKSGYSVFLIDLQAHGENPGDSITFGLRESASARKAVDYLNASGNCRNIASLGVSLGGAASLLGNEPVAVDAYILEGVYASIEQAVSNRIAMRLGRVANIVAPLLYMQLPLRLDISLRSLQPREAIKHIDAPVLIIAGTDDKHTTLQESKTLYRNAPHPKQLWVVENAAHVDFYTFSRQKYKETVLNFLNRHFE